MTFVHSARSTQNFAAMKYFHSPRVTSDLVPPSKFRNDDRGRDGARKPHCSVLGLCDPSFRPASSLTSRFCPQVIVPLGLLPQIPAKRMIPIVRGEGGTPTIAWKFHFETVLSVARSALSEELFQAEIHRRSSQVRSASRPKHRLTLCFAIILFLYTILASK